MRYNPDGDPADFDPHDVEMVDGYLADPGNDAMVESLGREFLTLPAHEQIPELEAVLADFVQKREELKVLLRGAQHDDPRRGLLTALEGHIESFSTRIADLTGIPEHP